MGIRKFQTATVTVKVIQGYWQWCHSISHIQFLIRLPLQPCVIISHRFRDITYFTTFKEVTHYEDMKNDTKKSETKWFGVCGLLKIAPFDRAHTSSY